MLVVYIHNLLNGHSALKEIYIVSKAFELTSLNKTTCVSIGKLQAINLW